MIKISICDDSPVYLEKLRDKITSIMESCRVRCSVSLFPSGKEFLKQHTEIPFDVVFLDIKMPDMDGFKVAERIRKTSENTVIIFVTTEDSMVYDSFSFQPFDFIPKIPPIKLNPKEGEDFISARIEKTIKRLLHRLLAIEKIGIDLPYNEQIYIPIRNILFVKTAGNYVEYSIKGREPIKVRRKLDEAMYELDSNLFVRLHKSYGVNMDFIKKIDFSELTALLKDDSLLTISRSRKKEAEAAYIEYLRHFGG